MKPILSTLVASVVLMSGAHGHAAEYHLGEWLGTWQSGETSGHFNLDLERAADGKLVGNIDVSTDGSNAHEYAVDLRYVDFDGNRFTAVFLTPGKNAEVVKLAGTLDQAKGSGEWVARKRVATPESESDSTAASGTWVLEKQER